MILERVLLSITFSVYCYRKCSCIVLYSASIMIRILNGRRGQRKPAKPFLHPAAGPGPIKFRRAAWTPNSLNLAMDAALAVHAPPPKLKAVRGVAVRASPPRAQHLFTGLLPLPWRPTSMEWSMSVVWIPAAALPESD